MALNPTWLADGIPMCAGCRRTPDELASEYAEIKEPGESNVHFVLATESTLDRATGLFLCNLCYIRAGTPGSPHGWKATTENLKRVGITS
jgi:hypothetical protein